MNIPGFTADRSLYTTSGRYQGATNQSDPTKKGQRIIGQLLGGGFGTSGGLGFHWPTWCEIECTSAAAACIAATSGIGTAACILGEIACLRGCRSFGGFGGFDGSGYLT